MGNGQSEVVKQEGDQSDQSNSARQGANGGRGDHRDVESQKASASLKKNLQDTGVVKNDDSEAEKRDGGVDAKGDAAALSRHAMGKLGEGLAALLSQQRKERQEKASSSGGTSVGSPGDTASREGRAENPVNGSEASPHAADKPHKLPNQPGDSNDSESRDPRPAQVTPSGAVVSGRTHDDEASEASKASRADKNAASTGTAGTDSSLSSSSSSSTSSSSLSLSSESKGAPQPQPEKPESSKPKAEESSPSESGVKEDSGNPTTPRKAERAAANKDDAHAPSVRTNGGERGAAAGEALSLSPMSPPPAAVRSPSLPTTIENDPQLDCTLKTLEAVHGAFYSPEHVQHGQPR